MARVLCTLNPVAVAAALNINPVMLQAAKKHDVMLREHPLYTISLNSAGLVCTGTPINIMMFFVNPIVNRLVVLKKLESRGALWKLDKPIFALRDSSIEDWDSIFVKVVERDEKLFLAGLVKTKKVKSHKCVTPFRIWENVLVMLDGMAEGEATITSIMWDECGVPQYMVNTTRNRHQISLMDYRIGQFPAKD